MDATDRSRAQYPVTLNSRYRAERVENTANSDRWQQPLQISHARGRWFETSRAHFKNPLH
jgi:hypothetical protein